MIKGYFKVVFILLALLLVCSGIVSAESKTELKLTNISSDNFVEPSSNQYYYIPGDVEGSGELTVSDAIIVLRYVVGLAPLQGNALQAADVNFDGYIDVSDAILILRKIVGLDTISSVNNPAIVYTENALKYIIEMTDVDVELASDIYLGSGDMIFLNRPVDFEGNNLLFQGIIVINSDDVVVNNLNIKGNIDLTDRESHVRESGSNLMLGLVQEDEYNVVLNDVTIIYLIVEAGKFKVDITGNSSVDKVLVYSDVTINGSDKTGAQYYRGAEIDRPDGTEPSEYTSQMVSFEVGAGDINNHFPLAGALLMYYCTEIEQYFSFDYTGTEGMVNKALPPGDYIITSFYDGYFMRNSHKEITEGTEGVSITYYLIPESEGGTLEVNFIDAVSGAPVKNASVEIRSSSYSDEKYTDSEGSLSFFAPSGTYVLYVRHDEYLIFTMEVRIYTGSTESKDIEIDPLGKICDITGTIHLPNEAKGKKGDYFLFITPDSIDAEHGSFYPVDIGNWETEDKKIDYSGIAPEGTYYLVVGLEYENEDDETINLYGLYGGYYPDDVPDEPNMVIHKEQINNFDIYSESFGLDQEES